MPLAGRQLSIGWALALCSYVGFRRWALVKAVAIMSAESGRYVGAWHDNIDPKTGNCTSVDRGLFQINDKWHPDLDDGPAFMAIPNAAYAAEMTTRGKYWDAWAVEQSKAYVKFIPLILPVIALNHWPKKVPRVEAELGEWGNPEGTG